MSLRYGKYRATVVANVDPMQLGRLQLLVPDVLGTTPSGWALPCLPPGARPSVPAVGDAVWVEFEAGNVDDPLWCGVFWTETAKVPESLRHPASPDAVSLRMSDGTGIDIGPSGIVIDNGKGARIEMAGPAVSINNGALQIV